MSKILPDFEPSMRNRSVLATDETATILDDQWARQAFAVSWKNLNDIDVKNRTFSTVQLKFTDTSLGGSYAINAKPQFTRYSDVRSKGILAGREDTTIGATSGKLGMGRYYSEAIDDTGQTIHMRFGVPQYNSLTQFFTGYYNTGAGRLARTGRNFDFFSTIGFAVGLVAQIVIWPIAAVHAIGYIGNFFFSKQTSKYYYLKPTMFVYWSAVNSMVNKIAVGKGLFPVIFQNDGDGKPGSSYKLDKDTDMLKRLNEFMPEMFSEDGGYDIYAVANRAQRMKIAADRETYERMNQEGSVSFLDLVKDAAKVVVQAPGPRLSWKTAFQQWVTAAGNKSDALPSWNDAVNSTSKSATPDNFEKDIRGIWDPKQQRNNVNNENKKSWLTYLTSELDDGSAFATFRVDYTGTVSESFSNSIRESDISSKMNGISSSARSASFSFAGGSNIGGAVGSVIDGATSAIKSFATGALDSIGFSGLMQLAGGAFVDIPKHWDSSSASLPKSSYTMQLYSPYGNVVSQMQNIYIPLSMILAAALPLSTGKQSYTSPFILELYDRGRHQTRLGMIDSLSITRGVSNLGFNKNGQAMAIDVSFSVVDMSSVMHMQIAKGFLSNDENGVFDEETVFSDYMNTLSSLSLHEQFHTIPKLRLRAARSLRNLQSLTSPAAWGSFVKNETPVGMLEMFYKGTKR
jgi:hypothetical protein